MSKTPAVSTNANTVAKHISSTENFVNAAKALLCPLRLFLIIPPLSSASPPVRGEGGRVPPLSAFPAPPGEVSFSRGVPLRLPFVRLAARSW